MVILRKCLILLLAVIIITGCKSKKKPSLSGDDPVAVSDFIGFFPTTALPYQLTDSIFLKKDKDSMLIGYNVFTQFVPDSVLNKIFGKGVKPKIYPLGKTEVSGAETYLFVKVISGNKKAVFIASFDKKEQFITALPGLNPDQSAATTQSVTMDRKYTITKTIAKKNMDGSVSEGKEVYVLNTDARNFMLIMTDALEDKMTELINPIDTLPRKNKFSADYGTGKMNLVSVRDGRKNDRISFFIHFEKNNGECTGELKGEAMLRSASVAEYREEGDPCVLKFSFTSSSVTLKEDGCGARRGMKCLFDGSFPRKKVVKPKEVKRKNASKK